MAKDLFMIVSSFTQTYLSIQVFSKERRGLLPGELDSLGPAF